MFENVENAKEFLLSCGFNGTIRRDTKESMNAQDAFKAFDDQTIIKFANIYLKEAPQLNKTLIETK